MRDIKTWLTNSIQMIKQFEHSNSEKCPASLLEVDIVTMFPSIDKLVLLQSLDYVFMHWLQVKHKRTRSDVFFALHKTFKKLDRIGLSDRSDYYVLTWKQIRTFLDWEILENTVFRWGTNLFYQNKGVPIGGPCSAQLASLYCMSQELVMLNTKMPKIFFAPPIRYRDNLFLMMTKDFSSAQLLLFLKKMYLLDFSVESRGYILQSLEFYFSWTWELKDMVEPNSLLDSVKHKPIKNIFTLQWKHFTEPEPARPEMTIKRWVNPQSINAKTILKSYVPSAKLKCDWYALDASHRMANMRGLQAQLIKNHFPKSWYMFLMKVNGRKRSG